MKYAIISDIHGNYPALEAVLKDAEAGGADMYLFIGDYCSGFPYCNEVAETLRGLKNATIIAGNHEGYLQNLHAQDQSTWTDKQFGLIYWCYRNLSPESLDFLMGLPQTAIVENKHGNIHLAHSRGIFFKYPNKIEYMHSNFFRNKMEEEPFTHDEYLKRAREAVLSRKEALEEINALPGGVYLFGHNHLQFDMEFEGRLFINPGSCGEALDGDKTAAYTWLEYSNNGWVITERRVPYDIEKVVARLHESGYSTFAPHWSSLYERVLHNGFDYIGEFFIHLKAAAERNGELTQPFSNKTWDEAVEAWNCKY